MNVTLVGAGTPSSVSTRTVSALLVGSMNRPSTSDVKASSLTASKPSASNTPRSASHTISDAVPSTTGCPTGQPPPEAVSNGNSPWPACNRSCAACSSAGSWPFVIGRADVLDPEHRPALLVHDLNRRRTRGRRHPTHEQPHPTRLPGPHGRFLVTTSGPPTRQRRRSAPPALLSTSRAIQLR
jgi:hypothetical protein